jgi:hypothetical protein
MGIILGFLPYVAFFALQSRIGTPLALLAGAVIALGVAIHSRLTPPHAFNVLDIGTVVTLVALAAYVSLTAGTLSVLAVQLCVKVGMLIIALISMAIRQPFTLPYARQQVDAAYWNSPRLIHANFVITAAWSVAFAAAVLVDVIVILNPAVPQPVGFVAAACSLGGALGFTIWYSKRAKA